MRFLFVIPARYASTRFPGKPLAMIHGMSMIERVYRQAEQALVDAHLVVATDDERIYKHVQDFGGRVAMTSPETHSGSDRCAEVMAQQQESFDVVMNIQGDEPFILPAQIEALADLFNRPEVQIGTLCKKIVSNEELFNPSCVKVILNDESKAMYFSRHPIPFVRNFPTEEWLSHYTFYKHLGVYAYRAEVLSQLWKLPVSGLETAESLEQLRWLDNGFSIHVAKTDFQSVAVDIPEDLEKAEAFLANKGMSAE